MPDAQPLLPGDPMELGPYKILGRLGEGGQGGVFLGRAPHSDHVAIKLLHARLSDNPTARTRFVRELDVAKQVARFCTAQVLDADVAGDRPYIVSEYVDGRSLQDLVRTDGPRTGGALERLAIGTLTALTAIHQAGIVHRDFKPHNVMLGSDGPRVIDFGVARALGAAGDTESIGSPAYMAPEQFASSGIGPGTDMFAWAATMVFAATGRPPFGNDEIAAVMHRILHGEPEVGPLPSPLREVVTACLVKDPAQRPAARDAQQRLLGTDAPSDASTGSAGMPASPPGQGIPATDLGFSTDAFAAAASSMGSAGLVDPPADAPPAASHGSPDSVQRQTERPAAAPMGPPPRDTDRGAPPGQDAAAPAGPPPYTGAPQHHRAPHTGAPHSTVPGPPREPRRLPRRPLPVAAGVIVGGLLLGGLLWVARGSDAPSQNGNRQAAPSAPTSQTAVPTTAPSGGSATLNAQRKAGGAKSQRGQTAKPSSNGHPGGDSGPQPSAPGGSGGSGGGGGGATNKPNPYTATQVCNSGGHGGGYYVQRSSSFTGGRTYQLYNSSGYNCVVTLKTASVGQKTRVWARLKRQSDGKSVTDDGSYAYYAGPVFLSARGICVAYAGGTSSGSTSAGWANCG